jgi:hypothetical protein
MGSTPPGGLTNLIATTVSETAPTLNQNNSLKLGIRDFTDRDANAYLYFTIPFPLKAQILSAKIKFYTTAITESGSHGFKFTRLGVKFNASTVTYSTRPVTFISGDLSVSKTGPNPDKTEWEIDITAWMNTVSNGGPWYGVRVVPTIFENIARWIYSELWTDVALRPRVEITWSDQPKTPTNLSPGGGRRVGLNKPTVKASFLDVSGSVALAGVRVQANATDVWTAPTYDSTEVPSTVPELDLSRSDIPVLFSAMTNGQTLFWRIQFKDAAGLWSPWSASTSFTYDDPGVLTVNNPPSGTPTVEDATPLIAWGFTGETQSAYQIQIYHVVNGVRIIDWDTGKLTSTVTSVTVPSGKINEPTNTTYTVTVRVWDTKSRENIPGSPPYVEVVRTFTFVPGAATGTTSLTAVPDAGGKPKVVLTWLAATFPDKFNILRQISGGPWRVIASQLDPNDTFVSGTTHTWIDRTPSPKRLLNYQVQRVVNGVASATNSTASNIVVNSRGRWLQEPVSGLELFIAGKEDVDMDLSATESTLVSIAPDAVPVGINQSLGGLTGTLQGLLVTSPDGVSAQTWRNVYMEMRRLRIKRFYLTMDDYTMAVICQEFKYARKVKSPRLAFQIGFRFYQQDHISNPITG